VTHAHAVLVGLAEGVVGVSVGVPEDGVVGVSDDGVVGVSVGVSDDGVVGVSVGMPEAGLVEVPGAGPVRNALGLWLSLGEVPVGLGITVREGPAALANGWHAVTTSASRMSARYPLLLRLVPLALARALTPK
jgi:hypothetical protein